jgi:general secretion pathway protein A
MYEAYYGLKAKPFQLNPDPAFYFGSRPHRRAMGFLEYGLHQAEGFIVVTGEIGAGKTTIVRSLIEHLDAKKVIAAHMVSSQLDDQDMLYMVAGAFGIKTKDVNKAQLLLAIEAFLVTVAKKGKRCLLIVDEAQNLTARALEELRMLSNFQFDSHALLQSFLIGQPEFRRTLDSPSMEQLRQRVIAACHVSAMDAAETKAYIEHRLNHVGWRQSPHFDDGAFEAIFESSAGIPRKINSICDRLMLAGMLEDKRVFTKQDVVDVANEFHGETAAPRSKLGDTWTEAVAAPPLAPDASPDLQDVAYRAAALQTEYQKIEARLKEAGSGSGGDNSMLVERLRHIEQGLIRLETTMMRVERSNQSAMTMFRGLVEWVKQHEPAQ